MKRVKTISKATSRQQLAATVVRCLEKEGISCVLVGGSCVSIYTEEKHHSKDLDFISPHSHHAISEALEQIGFRKKGRYFVHPKTEFYLEFPSGPLGIGSEAPVRPAGRLKVDGVTVRLLSPTQCVMDRLAAWFHWGIDKAFYKRYGLQKNSQSI